MGLNSNLRIRLMMISNLSIESIWTSQMIVTLCLFLKEYRCIRTTILKCNSKSLLSTTLDEQWLGWTVSLVITPHLRSGMITTILVKQHMRSISLLSGYGTIMNPISNIKKIWKQNTSTTSSALSRMLWLMHSMAIQRMLPRQSNTLTTQISTEICLLRWRDTLHSQ